MLGLIGSACRMKRVAPPSHLVLDCSDPFKFILEAASPFCDQIHIFCCHLRFEMCALMASLSQTPCRSGRRANW
jgi:hypothetical protein